MLEYQNGDQWSLLKEESNSRLIANTVNNISFNKVSATAVRITFKHETKPVALVELEVY
jgi:hypothetical protein